MKLITANEFDTEVAQSTAPVVIDFDTDHCRPCKMMAPVLKELSTENADRFKLVKVDAIQDAQLASQFSVTTVPTFLVLLRGAPVGQRSGMQSKQALLDWIEETIAGN